MVSSGFDCLAAPLQKLFVIPLAHVAWALLSLMPFIFLRIRWVFITYVASFSTALAVLAYDYLVPFRYVASGFPGLVSNPAGGFSPSGNDDSIAYWISYPTIPIMDFPIVWTDPALQDLEELVRFIATDDSAAAIRIGVKSVKHVEILQTFPEIGPVF
ncbi:MAG: type II toxin-antitoxin system RelE/ParE family toxin [Verrucomicrobia bacterium]|jgi:hypothetical protein|nr:type II toxin-antitoxin system RelE/ParE family toxin [Verrucomicrobiota bacterium]